MLLSLVWASKTDSSNKFWQNRIKVQLNECETDRFFLQNFQSNTKAVCLIIHVFCIRCEHEIFLAVLQIKTKIISCLQTLQNAWIIQQTVILLWKFWRNYGCSVSYLFCWMGFDNNWDDLQFVALWIFVFWNFYFLVHCCLRPIHVKIQYFIPALPTHPTTHIFLATADLWD